MNYLHTLMALASGLFEPLFHSSPPTILNCDPSAGSPASGRKAGHSRKRLLAYRPRLESLEERCLLATGIVSWVGGTMNKANDWGTATNWQPPRVPLNTDAVYIESQVKQNHPIHCWRHSRRR